MRCSMTQEFVAEQLGVSRQAVSKWENGTSDPSTSNLLALAKLFGVSASELLKNGRLVAIPTETVYGLGANALDGKAVKSVYEAKGRPSDNPMIVHISAFEDINKFGLVKEIPQTAIELAKHFWPGPLTMIMEKSDIVPTEVSPNLSTVAIRFPSHKVAQQIIKSAGVPVEETG